MQSQAFVAVTGMNNKVENRLVTIGTKTSELDGEANLTFDGSTLTVAGNLTVTGTTTTVSSTNTIISDQLIELGNGRTGSASGDAGIIVERGSDTNAALIFDESEDVWKVCTTAATGASSGDLTLTDAALKAAAITSSGVVTATGFTIGSAAISEAELERIDGITAGTVAASKAIVADANLDISGGRNITITGELDAGSLDISGDVDVDGTLEADAITVNGDTLAEVIQDTVGAMVGGNTETGISVTYEDSDGTLDFALSQVVEAGIADNAVTLAKLAGIPRGQIIYGDTNGDPALLALGSNGQVLTSDGTDVSWQDASGGGGGGGGSANDDSNLILHMQVFT